MSTRAQTSIKTIKSLIIALAVLLAVAPAHAIELKNNSLKILVADNALISKRIADRLLQIYPSAKIVGLGSAPKKNEIQIAIGPTAFRSSVSNYGEGVVVSLFTSSATYGSILDGVSKKILATGIFSDPSPLHQLQLISLIYPRGTKVAVLVGAKTTDGLSSIRRAAIQAGVDLKIEHMSGGSINETMFRLRGYPVLLALPDSSIYSPETIRPILLSAYRHNQCIIGFSANMVSAGALASINSSIEDIILHGVDLIEEIDATGNVPAPQYPKYFDVVINETVARLFSIPISDRVRNFAKRPSGGSPPSEQ